jgi:DNA-binding NarL/FixJ family response regulator
MRGEARVSRVARPGGNNGPLGNPLSPREVETLELIAQGDLGREIAAKLYVSESTVKTWLYSISQKLGTRGQAHAVDTAWRLGILPIAPVDVPGEVA